MGKNSQLWQKVRVKDVAAINPSTRFVNSVIPFLPMADISTNGFEIKEYKAVDDIPKYSQGQDGDVLFAKVTPCFENGKGCVLTTPSPVLATTEVTVLRAYKTIGADYLRLITQSDEFKNYGVNSMKGANGLKRFNEKASANYSFGLPSIAEQQQIVAYVNDRTSAIDSKIQLLEEKATALADLRKSVIHKAVTKGLDPNVAMKPSGVEWIGAVPSHWLIKRLKNIAGIKKGEPFPEASSDAKDYPYFNGGKNPSGWSEYFNSDDTTVAVSEGGASAGYVHSVKSKYWAGSHCYIVKPTNFTNVQYLYYLLKAGEEQFILAQTGSAMPNLQKSRFMNQFACFVQDSCEQSSIVEYLDKHTAIINEIIKTITEQIATLKSLRQSLIHEAVTGKIDVADYGYNYA